MKQSLFFNDMNHHVTGMVIRLRLRAGVVRSNLPMMSKDAASLCGECKGAGRCGACFFLKHSSQLLQEFPWLEVQKDPSFGVGCSVCRKFAGPDSSTAASHGGLWECMRVTSYSSLQKVGLRKHESSDKHQRASECGDVTGLSKVPNRENFESLVKHIRKSSVGRTGLDDVGGQKKCRKMLWCLAEAHRMMKRRFWNDGMGVDGEPISVSTSIFQDARKGRLTVRFTAASSRLEKLEGHLGTVDLASEFSADSVGLMQATQFVVASFCVPFFAAPYVECPSRLPDPNLDEQLHERLKNSIETFVSDAAADEIRAGHMLAGQTTSSTYRPGFPALKLVVRDRPHATRRNLSRGWAADPALEEIIQRFVLGPHSPTRLIQYSSQFKQLFATNIRKLEADLSEVKAHEFVKDLGFAAHRFESLQKPLSRIVLFFPAFLTTLVQVAWQRKGSEEGTQALDFIQWLSPAKCLLMAMMADAGQENLELTRMVDYQNFPVEDLGFNLSSFVARLKHLFVGDQPLCLSTGFTGHMMKLLQKEFCFNLPSGRGSISKQLGSAEPLGHVVINQCLQHMVAWVRLTEETIEAEFPSFHVQSAFACFNVSGEHAQISNAAIRRSSHIARLCSAFKIPEKDAAVWQLEKFRHVAAKVVEEEGLTSSAAWLEAARKITRSWSGKPALKALLPVLVRLWAAGASTSGVEQSFSQAEKSTRLLQLPGHVNDLMEAYFDGKSVCWVWEILLFHTI